MSTYPRHATATIERKGSSIVVRAEDGTEDEVKVAAGGTLEFRTPANSPFKWWSILWQDETPCEDGAGWASEARGRRKVLSIDDRADGAGSAERRYKFAVVASDTATVYFKDPDVVVGPQTGP